jgi:hypothetical protein
MFKPPRLVKVLLLSSALGACHGQIGGSSGDPGNPGDPGSNPSGPVNPGDPPAAPQPEPFEAVGARAYASKVKDLLTGLALTDKELAAVSADPKVMRTLIDGWMSLPSYRDKMMAFFAGAFQQTQLDPTDLEDQMKLGNLGMSGADQQRMLKSVVESFSRTVLALVDAKRPFTETVTTNRFMVNLPLMVMLSYMDATPQNDTGGAVGAGYWLTSKLGKGFQAVLTTNTDPTTLLPVAIPFTDSINPASPNFMHWSFVQPADLVKNKACTDPTLVTGNNIMPLALRALFGIRQACGGASSPLAQILPEDWTTWRMVTIRQPRAGEERTTFWDVAKLRASNELVLATPRVGFFTTPAFFANWPTNTSNSYRVTLNQTLIVALGRSFDDRATTVQISESSVDAQHAQPGTICYGCHQTLDPMRDFFKQSYSLTYSQQLSALDPKQPALPTEGVFSVEGGPVVRGQGVATLAGAMAAHPLFATAWTQRLCQLANAAACEVDDPEFKRVAAAFASSNFDFPTLVRELYSSPLVTYAARTATTTANGVVISIARRDALCDRLSIRLGLADLCNQQGASGLPKIGPQAHNLALGVPGSAYNRADATPVSPHDPNLFFSSATEKLCGALAGQLVEVPMTGRWKVADKATALSDFVTVLMGVPASEPLAPTLIDVLSRHFDAAVAAKETPADALRSTFTLACSSPLAVSAGL